jgi:hypothetical protein
MSSRRLLLVGLVFIGLAAVAAGCRKGGGQGQQGVTRTYDQPVPDAPPAGHVRIVGENVREDAGAIHWKWTVVGDRNWTSLTSDGDSMTLADPYPLDATDRFGGTNAFECELVLTLVPSGQGSAVKCKHSFNRIGTRTTAPGASGYVGSGGSSGDRTLWSDVRPVALVGMAKVLIKGDQVLPLPLDQPLVELTGRTSDGRPLSHEIRLKIPE